MGKKQPSAQDFQFQFSEFALSEQDGKRKFSGVAYSGGVIENHDFWGRVTFDLSDASAPERLPILLEHDRDKRIGFSSDITITDKITLSGEMLSNAIADSVISDADDGFPWQMSVHISPDRIEEIPIDKPVIVNGHEFSGGYVFRTNKIREVSFTPTGWDDKTNANIFSTAGDQSVSDPKDKEAIESLTQQNTDLKASNDALTAKVAELEDSIKSIKASERTEQIKTLFSDMGREYSEDAAKHYMSLDSESFSAIAKDMRESRSKVDEHLFSEQATGGQPQGEGLSLVGEMKKMVGAE
jgi:hypothetical protein